MISESKLKEICDNYNINHEKLIQNNSYILNMGDYNKICEVLEFLKSKLHIASNNIEKCPNILLIDTQEIKKTYKYIIENYSIVLINEMITILRVPTDRIIEIEKQFIEFDKKTLLQMAISRFNIEEIKRIVEVCKENGIEPKGTVFLKSAEEIKEIIEVCKENGIKPTGTVFLKSAEEIKKIIEVGIEPKGNVFKQSAEEIKKIIEVCKENGIESKGNVFLKSAEEIKEIIEVCKENGIEPKGSVFLKSAEEIKKIVEVCKENGIEPKGSVFLKSAEEIKQNIMYVRNNYGIEYVTNVIVSKNYNNLTRVLPYLKENRWLDAIRKSASILSLTLEEIKERVSMIEKMSESIIITNKNGEKVFNSIFGLPRRKYAEKVKSAEKGHYKTKTVAELARAIAKDGTPLKVDEASEFINGEILDINNNNEREATQDE